jgi:hypothetical protein
MARECVPGDRIRLISTTDPHTRLSPGSLGTAGFVDGRGTVHVTWDDGHKLGLIPGIDHFEVLPADPGKPPPPVTTAHPQQTGLLLERIAEQVWQATRQKGLPESCCIAATKITEQVARYFGLRGKAQPVRIVVANQAAIPFITAGVPVTDWPAPAWSVGTDGSQHRPGRYPGHLVLLVHSRAAAYLVDSSLPQYARPRLDLSLRPLVTRLNDAQPFTDDDPAVAAIDGGRGVVTYRPYHDGGLYRRAPDWMDGKRRYQAMIGELIRTIRKTI